MNDMLLVTTLAGVEKLINSALDYDPGTRIALEKFKDQVLAVSVTTPAITLYITSDDQGVRLMNQWEGEVHTRLHGSLSALIKLARNEHGFVDSGVEFMCNTGLLIELQRLLKNLDIDWEEALSERVGDIVGHQSAQTIRTGVQYARDRSQEMNRSLGEFLTQELKTLVSKQELEIFYQDVDELRLHMDRLEARVKLFARSHNSPTETPPTP